MSGQTTVVLMCTPLDAPRVRAALEESGFELDEAPYAFFRARGPACTVTFYEKGKVVLQGPGAEDFVALVDPAAEPEPGAEPLAAVHPFDEALGYHPSPAPEWWAGIDETGKGDYFGPLVVVAAAVERSRVPLLRELGVADSKKLADSRVLEIAKDLKSFCPFAKVVVGPERYNALYARVANLNRLLAWGHARALEDLLERAPQVTYAISDQFARDPGVLQRQLMERARAVRVDQRTKAEADPAVAVASILARAELLWQMRALEKQVGHRLPKGAGPPVLAAGRELVASEGREILSRVAKLHFKTTERL